MSARSPRGWSPRGWSRCACSWGVGLGVSRYGPRGFRPAGPWVETSTSAALVSGLTQDVSYLIEVASGTASGYSSSALTEYRPPSS